MRWENLVIVKGICSIFILGHTSTQSNGVRESMRLNSIRLVEIIFYRIEWWRMSHHTGVCQISAGLGTKDES